VNGATRSSDKILIYVTADPSTAMLIRRGKRVADYLHAECFAVTVVEDLSLTDAEAVERHLNFARNLHIETRILEGPSVAETLVEFARLNGVTQLFLSRPKKDQWPVRLQRSLVQQVVRLARDMQVTIVADRQKQA